MIELRPFDKWGGYPVDCSLPGTSLGESLGKIVKLNERTRQGLHIYQVVLSEDELQRLNDLKEASKELELMLKEPTR